MDPRLDNGMAQYGNLPPQFDCYAPLLPEEVCWILDRAFAAEVSRPHQWHQKTHNQAFCKMTWHKGYALSQTIYTLLYVHGLENLEPSRWYRFQKDLADNERPGFLVTDILRAGVLGLVKSCDMAWRELSKRHIYEVCLKSRI